MSTDYLSTDHSFRRKPAWLPAVATIGYGAVVAALLYLAGGAIADLLERRAAVAASADILDQLQGRRAPVSNVAGAVGALPAGSPFLEGPTVTVAGAALLQRVATAVNRVGGNILSSHVELEGAQSRAGFVVVTASCEVEQPALQRLLYDLEAGMPYLFVDQLVAQAPVASVGSQQGRMRVLLTVYGQWQGGR
jgi:general secretion pathway protein M